MKRLGLVCVGTLLGATALAVGCSGDDEFKPSPNKDAGTEAATGGAAGSGATGGTGGQAGGGTGGAAGSDAGGAAGQDSGPVCTDADNDGQTDCDGDCDDSDPTTLKGAKEICGDNADNDCSGQADDGCGGIGTYVSEKTGDDNNPGTKLSPVKTIGKGMANAQTILGTTPGSIDVYVAEGTYAEKVKMAQGVNLLGGHSCATAPCNWTRDPKTYTSTIQNQDAEGVLADHNVFRTTRIDGFTITGWDGDTTGMAPGTVGITANGGTPTIINNVITGGKSTGGTWPTGHSIGIAVLTPANDPQGVAIDGNTISGGESVTNGSLGVYFTSLPGVVGKTYGLVVRNTINGGKGKNSSGIGFWSSGTGTTFRDNDIQGGEATAGGSWGIVGNAIALIDGNRINTDPNNKPKCSAQTWCGGLMSESSTTVIVNNVIYGADATLSTGVRLAEFEQPAGAVILSSNTIDGGGQSSGIRSAAIAMEIGAQGKNAIYGRISNNILIAGTGASARYGVYEVKTSGRTAHPELFMNNDLWIPSSGNNDALYHFWNGANATVETTIAGVNALSSKFGPVSGNISADCLLDATWHLGTGSLCIDAGIKTDAPALDFEGDTRPGGAGYDIGADEKP